MFLVKEQGLGIELIRGKLEWKNAVLQQVALDHNL